MVAPSSDVPPAPAPEVRPAEATEAPPTLTGISLATPWGPTPMPIALTPAARSRSLRPPPPDPCDDPDSLDVLFIGNSYMLMHDVPDLVAALGEQAGIELHTELLAMGGKDFDYHLSSSRTADALAEGDWDVVVLQSHSLDPIRDPEGFLEAGEALAAMVRQAGAEPILFETWPRKAGSDYYMFGRGGGNPDAMHRLVHAGYHELAERTGADVIDVAAAWRALHRVAPDLDPYTRDANHPGRLGSYLTANVVFAALTDTTPVDNVAPLLGIGEDDARVLQETAAAVIGPSCE
jgi:hypothetical protein